MAIKRGSKVDKSFSSASMTDLIFLLLLFMLIATTLINPNAIKLILPKSSNQLKDKAMTTISIQDTGHGYRYYVETENVGSREGVEKALKSRLAGQENPTVSLHCDKSVAFDEVVAMMRMAKANNFTLIAAAALYYYVSKAVQPCCVFLVRIDRCIIPIRITINRTRVVGRASQLCFMRCRSRRLSCSCRSIWGGTSCFPAKGC